MQNAWLGGGGDRGGARYARLDQGEIYKNKGTKGYNMTQDTRGEGR